MQHSEPGSSLHRIKTARTRLSEVERLHHDAIEHYNVDPIVYLKTPQQKRHIFKKSLFPSSKDDISMSASADPVKELTEEDLTEDQIHLIPRLPGQTTDDIKVPTREVSEYVYKNFTDANARKYLRDIQPWLYFRRLHNKKDYSIPVLDFTGKEYPDFINWMLTDIDSLPTNAQKLQEIQLLKQKQHPCSVPTDTSKTTQSDKPTST